MCPLSVLNRAVHVQPTMGLRPACLVVVLLLPPAAGVNDLFPTPVYVEETGLSAAVPLLDVGGGARGDGGAPWTEDATISLDPVAGSYLEWMYAADGTPDEHPDVERIAAWRADNRRYWRPEAALARPLAPADDFFHDPNTDRLFVQSQGARRAMRYAGRELFKTSWDFAVLPQLLAELLPRTVVEVGSGTGASALWIADALETARRYAGDRGGFVVHSFDIKGPPPGAAHDRVVFHFGNSSEPERTWPAAFLAGLPHPWLVLDDAHVNVPGIVAHFLPHMEDGEYFYMEDSWGDRKRDIWETTLLEHEASLVVDALYTDFFGVNVLSAKDGVVRVARRPRAPPRRDPRDVPGA